MSRMPRAGGRYVKPLRADGVELTDETGHGVYTLAANTTYYYILGGADAPFQSAHLTGYTAAMVITSATIQDCNHWESDISNSDAVVGNWINEDPSTAFVAFDGTGWSASNGVVASGGSAVGGALWHLGEVSAFRTRLAVVVGSTGGLARVSAHGKD